MLDEAVLWTVLTRPRAEGGGVLEPPEHPPGYATAGLLLESRGTLNNQLPKYIRAWAVMKKS